MIKERRRCRLAAGRRGRLTAAGLRHRADLRDLIDYEETTRSTAAKEQHT
jgi:hypothetical protein